MENAKLRFLHAADTINRGKLDAPQSVVVNSTNTALGISALEASTGSNNTASGFQALKSNSKGFDNTADGNNALSSNTTGDYNTANGSLSLQNPFAGYGMKPRLYHVTPKSRGGKSTWENLVACCYPCNSRKGTRHPRKRVCYWPGRRSSSAYTPGIKLLSQGSDLWKRYPFC